MMSDKMRKAFPEIAALYEMFKPDMDALKKIYMPDQFEKDHLMYQETLHRYRERYYADQQAQIAAHLARTGGQTPLVLPYGLWEGWTISYTFEEAFDNWAAWLGGLVDE